MTRSIALLLIGLIFGGGIGFLTAAGFGVTLDGHDHDSHGAASMSETGHAAHQPLEIDPGPGAPELEIFVSRDAISGWNLRMVPGNFRFAPEHASGAPVAGEGHAHVYFNGVKIMRAYGPWVHLSALPAGDVTVRAALYSNDHRPLTVGGVAVAAEIIVPAGHSTPPGH